MGKDPASVTAAKQVLALRDGVSFHKETVAVVRHRRTPRSFAGGLLGQLPLEFLLILALVIRRRGGGGGIATLSRDRPATGRQREPRAV